MNYCRCSYAFYPHTGPRTNKRHQKYTETCRIVMVQPRLVKASHSCHNWQMFPLMGSIELQIARKLIGSHLIRPARNCDVEEWFLSMRFFLSSDSSKCANRGVEVSCFLSWAFVHTSIYITDDNWETFKYLKTEIKSLYVHWTSLAKRSILCVATYNYFSSFSTWCIVCTFY